MVPASTRDRRRRQMKAQNFDLESYARRIGYGGRPEPTIDCVSALMRHQLFAVPFENLDVQAGKIVSLVPEDIADKILRGRRGGYCYEVNGLFAMALDALRIPYRFVAARPMFYPVRRPRTHMAIVAEIEGALWLCDLGFGSYGIRAPIDLAALDRDIVQDFDTFRLTRSTSGDIVLSALVGGRWVDQFGFDLYAHEWIDFAPANHLNSTHPDAIFVQKLLVVRHRPEGRSILLGDRLKSIRSGIIDERTVGADELAAVLHDEFGLAVPVA